MSVVIPAKDAEATLAATLVAITGQTYDGGFEVVVVDDGSKDGTARIASSFPGVRLVRGSGEGPGPARNNGAGGSEGDLIAFTDADCRPAGDWLARAVEAMADADLVQGAVHPDPAQPIGPWDRTVWVDRETGLYETANLIVTRELFEQLGGFEDFLGPVIGKPLAEDVWFGWRARRAGARVRFDPRVEVAHEVFKRTPWSFIAEKVRVSYFPAIVAKVPELRKSSLFARYFLSRRSAELDLAVVSAGLAFAHPVALLGVVPYLVENLRVAFRSGRRAPAVAVVYLAADLVIFVSLLWGSARRRTIVM